MIHFLVQIYILVWVPQIRTLAAIYLYPFGLLVTLFFFSLLFINIDFIDYAWACVGSVHIATWKHCTTCCEEANPAYSNVKQSMFYPCCCGAVSAFLFFFKIQYGDLFMEIVILVVFWYTNWYVMSYEFPVFVFFWVSS